ncbi:MAG: hypothetical protein KDF95_01030 [Rhodocyclaceae bacterium]|nr:hypothetical protein [Rhodocyclaceae bacterium]
MPNGDGGKPKGMRWRRTFERMTTEQGAFVGEARPGVTRRLGILDRLVR